MEAEFVAKSAALVGRMTVAAAQANLHELRSELETLQDFAHMLRAQRLTRALAELARTVEELHISVRVRVRGRVRGRGRGRVRVRVSPFGLGLALPSP